MGRTLREVIDSMPQARQDEIARKAEEFVLENKLYEQYPDLLELISPEMRAKLQLGQSSSQDD